ncbi:MAG TPA: tetratricopeptide repeat protein [Polyangia bacterium]|nr:tetratricopeptide repeat protein [Polyangia bacterium]
MARLDLLREFVEKSPNDPFARYGLAMEYKNLSRFEDAAATFRTLLSLHPDYTAAYLHAGNTLVALGQREEARAIYQAGIAACTKKGDLHARNELEAALMSL